MSMRLDESVWSEEEEFEGETRESEVWGKGETVEGVSWKSISESLGEMCEVMTSHECWFEMRRRGREKEKVGMEGC